MLKAVKDVKAAGCNALVVFPGNFGPETPETLITKYSDGPCMFAAAAFDHHGRALFEVFKFLGVGDIGWNQPKSLPYPTENPWA